MEFLEGVGIGEIVKEVEVLQVVLGVLVQGIGDNGYMFVEEEVGGILVLVLGFLQVMERRQFLSSVFFLEVYFDFLDFIEFIDMLDQELVEVFVDLDDENFNIEFLVGLYLLFWVGYLCFFFWMRIRVEQSYEKQFLGDFEWQVIVLDMFFIVERFQEDQIIFICFSFCRDGV